MGPPREASGREGGGGEGMRGEGGGRLQVVTEERGRSVGTVTMGYWRWQEVFYREEMTQRQ